MRDHLTGLLTAALLGLALGSAPARAHKGDHNLEFHACAFNKLTGNSKWSLRDNTMVVRFRYKNHGKWHDWGSSGGHWKHKSGSEIHIQSSPNNGGKWWCSNDKRTHNVHSDHGEYASIGSAAAPAAIVVKYGLDERFDLIYLAKANPDHDTVCVRGDFSGSTDMDAWEVEVWTAEDDCVDDD